jgi:Cof subfamily protein (haloacid dehalogenase superfamily)
MNRHTSGVPTTAIGTVPTPAPDLPIRLIALDIDGTIVGEDLVLHDRTIRAVAEARRLGVHVSIVTGRMTSSAAGFARRLGLDGPIVGYQGAIARTLRADGDDGLGRLLWHRPLPADVARRIVRWTRDAGLEPHFNDLERLVLRSDEPRADDYSAFVGGRLTLVPDLEEWLAGRATVTKVIAVGDGSRPRETYLAAAAAFGGESEVTISHPRFLEFVAPGVTKGSALVRLARRYRVPMAQVMAIGDQLNDIEMIAVAGHGVAMENAPAEVRAVARYVAPHVDSQGAARMIEDLVLDRQATVAARGR